MWSEGDAFTLRSIKSGKNIIVNLYNKPFNKVFRINFGEVNAYLVFGLKIDFQKWPNLVNISQERQQKQNFFSVILILQKIGEEGIIQWLAETQGNKGRYEKGGKFF